jgi:hypothetical protein
MIRMGISSCNVVGFVFRKEAKMVWILVAVNGVPNVSVFFLSLSSQGTVCKTELWNSFYGTLYSRT